MRVAPFALTFLLYATPSIAQIVPEPPIGTRIPQTPDFFPVDQSREVLRKFAECAVRKFPDLTHQMVLDASTVRVAKQYLKAADPDCPVQATDAGFDMVQMTMDPQSFRYAVANELAKKNLATFDPAGIASAVPLEKASLDPSNYAVNPGDKRTGYTQKDRDQAKQRDIAAIAMQAFGECVVRANPTASRNLLQTAINSDEELGALQAMIPSFSGCLDQGTTLKAGRSDVRGAVALTYYRLAYAPKSPQPMAQK